MCVFWLTFCPSRRCHIVPKLIVPSINGTHRYSRTSSRTWSQILLSAELRTCRLAEKSETLTSLGVGLFGNNSWQRDKQHSALAVPFLPSGLCVYLYLLCLMVCLCGPGLFQQRGYFVKLKQGAVAFLLSFALSLSFLPFYTSGGKLPLFTLLTQITICVGCKSPPSTQH